MVIQTERHDVVPAVSPAPLPALVAFFRELAADGIGHCSWKSNEHLVAGLTGNSDIDLLVARDDATRFREIAARHDLKPIVPPPDATHVAMEHLLGHDPRSGRTFHIHVHWQLVLGERHVKNHRIPLERAFLEPTQLLDGVPVPRPEMELVVLVIRTLLKYRARDVVKDVLGIRTPGLPGETRREIAWLLDRTTVTDVKAVLRADGGELLAPDLAARFLDIATHDSRSGYALFTLRRRVRRSLGHLRRTGRVRASARYFLALFRRRQSRRRPADTGMTLPGGGLTIALVGSDGSGKSTIAAALEEWLGWKLSVRTFYLGSKAPSRSSDWTYVAFRALRRGHRTVTARTRRPRAAEPIARTRDVMLALHHLAVARDRIRRHRRGCGDAQTGRVVIFDRLPLERISIRPEHRLLDGPQIRTVLDARRRGTIRRLAGVEDRMYRRIGLPDHLVVLDVNPDVSFGRKPDHEPAVLAAKSRAAAELASLAEATRSVNVIRIDANRDLDIVLRDLKARLWNVL